ncbi:MAG TPA: Rieske 2Fe-2S domain-containing protein [Candidatus Saccharimonadales bacterium]|nr:Rieske 2Fe-2S domain-containing protein [Candidatus Saccharimonadales bacterium]
MSLVDSLEQLVSWRDGLISPEIYFDEDLYAQEIERVFGHAWIPVGHSDMVRSPGDYITNYIGEVPIVILRDSTGTVRSFINRCRHRGNKVCLFDRGQAHSFTCSYHGWTYGLDGGLVGVPRERDLYADLDRASWGLEEVRVADFNGLLFATLDKDASSFENWLGADARWWLETFVLGVPVGGLEALPGWHRCRVPGNWKLMAENYIGDNYHVALTHAAWLRTAQELRERGSDIPMATSPLPMRTKEPTYEVTAGYGSGCPLGLGALRPYSNAMFERDLDEAKRLGPHVVSWLRDRQDRMQKALVGTDPPLYGFVNGLLFPNLGLMGYISPMIGRHLLLFHPHGATEHEQWQWTMVEREAPDVVKELAVQRVYQGQAMAGVIGPDDVENFERIVEAMRAKRAQRLPLNFQVHLNDDGDQLPGVRGNISKEPSEVNQRQFYRFWLELMAREPVAASKGVS